MTTLEPVARERADDLTDTLCSLAYEALESVLRSAPLADDARERIDTATLVLRGLPLRRANFLALVNDHMPSSGRAKTDAARRALLDAAAAYFDALEAEPF